MRFNRLKLTFLTDLSWEGRGGGGVWCGEEVGAEWGMQKRMFITCILFSLYYCCYTIIPSVGLFSYLFIDIDDRVRDDKTYLYIFQFLNHIL